MSVFLSCVSGLLPGLVFPVSHSSCAFAIWLILSLCFSISNSTVFVSVRSEHTTFIHRFKCLMQKKVLKIQTDTLITSDVEIILVQTVQGKKK